LPRTTQAGPAGAPDHYAVAFEADDEAFRDDRRHQLGRLRFPWTAAARQGEGAAGLQTFPKVSSKA
jgi:hypothetical protein